MWKKKVSLNRRALTAQKGHLKEKKKKRVWNELPKKYTQRSCRSWLAFLYQISATGCREQKRSQGKKEKKKI